MADYQQVFCDLTPPLDFKKAQYESSRCFYCYDAPCVTACPTQIDIPSFIRKINNGNIRGAATDILTANIMGATCSRVCPVENLCEEACVRNKSEDKPVVIGQLQRFATDEFFHESKVAKKDPAKLLFTKAPATGKKVAVIGGGPAGLSCAHRLATLGHEVTIFEAKSKLGGLNEYGLAPYKVTQDIAAKETEFILSIGGIKAETNKALGKDIQLESLTKSFDAVFLGIGLGRHSQLGIEGENLDGVYDATTFIEKIRQERNLEKIGIKKTVVVIGGGNTAIDIAIESKKLGASQVFLAYRRGPEHMSATWHEQELAKLHGVHLMTWMKPVKIVGDGKVCQAVDFEKTKLVGADENGNGGKLEGTGQIISFRADQVFKAIGQNLNQDLLKVGNQNLEVANGKIWTNENFETSVPGIFAGGDCGGIGEDLTVTAVQQGKLAAIAIDRKLVATDRKLGGLHG